MGEEFVGSGWAFPVRADPTGQVALVTGTREIEESIRLILMTAPGERPMRPEFGCAVHDYVYAPADASTAGDIAYAVRVALTPLGAAGRPRGRHRPLRRRRPRRPATSTSSTPSAAPTTRATWSSRST